MPARPRDDARHATHQVTSPRAPARCGWRPVDVRAVLVSPDPWPSRVERQLGGASPSGTMVPAPNPVARVLADTGLPHLDRVFDYQVPERFDAEAVPGSRVRVRFAGRLVDGYLLERVAASEHQGALSFLDRVVSQEPVLAPEVAELARLVADRYAGTMADVLRLAVPPRHAATEKKAGPPAPSELPPPTPDSWSHYHAGPAFLQAVGDRRPARAVWQAMPGEDWCARLAEAVHVAVAAGRGAIVVVPDARDVARLDRALTAALGPGRHVSLLADLGPAERYRRFLSVLRGQVQVAIGTRSAAFAPVRDLGLLALFDDGDDLLSEPRAPYPHSREVMMLRSVAAQAPLLIGGFARTAEAQLLVESGWAHPLVAGRTRSGPRPPGSRRPVTNAPPGPTPPRRTPGCHPRPSRPPGLLSPTTGRSWFKYPDAATGRGWPASPAGGPRTAGCAPDRSSSGRVGPSRPAAGAGLSPPAGRVRSVRRRRSARPSSGPSAPPKSSVGRSPACRCSPAPVTRCWTWCPVRRRWWWPPLVPSRRPRAVTVPRSCWTACVAGPPGSAGRGGGAPPLDGRGTLVRSASRGGEWWSARTVRWRPCRR